MRFINNLKLTAGILTSSLILGCENNKKQNDSTNIEGRICDAYITKTVLNEQPVIAYTILTPQLKESVVFTKDINYNPGDYVESTVTNCPTLVYYGPNHLETQAYEILTSQKTSKKLVSEVKKQNRKDFFKKIFQKY